MRVPYPLMQALDQSLELDPIVTEYIRQEPMYKALISELRILCHPNVRQCPNIVQMQAICWEIYGASHEICPVLIFPKSDFGDLRHFMQSAYAKGTYAMDSIELCADVARALAVLHANGMNKTLGDKCRNSTLLLHLFWHPSESRP